MDPAMVKTSPTPASLSLNPFFALTGRKRWADRLDEIRDLATGGPRASQAIRQRHAIELTIEKLRRTNGVAASVTEQRLGALAVALPALAASLTATGRERLIARLRDGLEGQNTLVPLFHLLRCALLQRARGFDVSFAGLQDDAPFDLLLTRDKAEAELACDVITAEEGRGVHRGAWFRLADRIDPDLQTWLAAHPGRYLLKMTLPQGLRGGLHDGGAPDETLSHLHQRIRDMLAAQSRQDHDEAIVLRLDPLLLAGAQAEDSGFASKLRNEFGPEAHLSVTTAGGGVFVMAARAGQENEVAIAIRRRLGAIAPVRLSGERPGILAMFVEDTDRTEWRGLRERLELEGEARQFLTHPEAKRVVAVSVTSRLEMFGLKAPDAAPDGELRFRNPQHPAAGVAGLQPAVMSTV